MIKKIAIGIGLFLLAAFLIYKPLLHYFLDRKFDEYGFTINVGQIVTPVTYKNVQVDGHGLHLRAKKVTYFDDKVYATDLSINNSPAFDATLHYENDTILIDYGKVHVTIKGGAGEMKIDNLHDISPHLYGSLEAHFQLNNTLIIDAVGKDLYYNNFFLDTFQFHSVNREFTAALGTARVKGHLEDILVIDAFDMIWKDHLIRLETRLQIGEEALLSIDAGKVFFRYSSEEFSANLIDVPLSLFTPSCDTLNAKLNITPKHGTILCETTHGTIDGAWHNDLLSLRFQMPLLKGDLNLPLHIALDPPALQLIDHHPISGNLVVDGRIEEVLDLFPMYEHRLEGDMNGRFKIENTKAYGTLRLKNGVYENYYTGVRVENLELAAEAQGETAEFILESKDLLYAEGKVALSPTLPYSCKVGIKNFPFAEIDLVSASVSGELDIVGDIHGANAHGNLALEESTVTIPDHIPAPLPDLEVTYKNEIRPPPAPTAHFFYPFHLDLNVKAPHIAIEGRGLESAWHGEFHVGGTVAAIATEGDLLLKQGKFHVASRDFDLLRGSLSFSGKPLDMPRLRLEAATDIAGTSIVAELAGALDDPTLTFRSTPSHSLSSILSLLLFGEELTEITGAQAIELATTLASIAGTGPNTLENMKRSIGIDRLRVFSDPNSDAISIEVGKYIAPGILVVITQYAPDAAPNMRIEVELKHHITLKLESDQRHQQGKFGLSWHRTY